MLTSSVFSSLNSDNVLSYIRQVQSFPVLSAEEEEKLAKSWYDNGIIADAHKLVTSHLRLVIKIAMGFKNYGLPLIELIMEGNIGLMQAVKKFNPNLGFRLSTYAMWWIKASIKDYILKSWSHVKIGTTQAQRKLFFSLRKIKKKLLCCNNITLDEVKAIANECSTSEQEVEYMNKFFNNRDVSLNGLVFTNNNDDNKVELQDIIPSNTPNQEVMYHTNEENYIKESLIQKALLSLKDRHRDIFIKRRLIDQPETLESLSIKYNVSKERIRQIELHSFNKVKSFIQANKEELMC
ncbi:RNA polymerase factor sigma-32 [Neoehrlichia mikurensis]|uniref:RNA polymerase factor sigma-32 n=1 Tax=Neoehrlichia mikurensis TaxID=89586 RepID=A0A9Q9F3G9_9RICK|nr:RNA polymerase factor sigma-32 [Neoehrlichia mikurensis]QXK91952.1 RNA polymerase factor sigma-32 [Neoehrlichia mikurensis]QXK93165.1 RNA polymerase factor sigma-32 [Neoehrlichia mikurensis]QXK93644.1 RNA polymerase factor sigma-32 [Neoehrlichia mikurensis]UTO55400.1 RNA polymerase factor sigma-32 [Neoehrlichia mikurensis]UTO56319.1 RNA polymerase factor sigma-32 [Neoehrlichia mikurensis]